MGVGTGWIEVITGPMFSGKTTTLLLRVSQARAVKKSVKVFKPAVDERNGNSNVQSLSGLSSEASRIKNSSEILSMLDEDTMVVAIDEIQFFDTSVIEVCNELANLGKLVIACGLDMDFLGRPFGPVPQLLSIAEVIVKLHALCVICGKPAHFSQRVIDGKPIVSGDDILLLGGQDVYEPRCRLHFLRY